MAGEGFEGKWKLESSENFDAYMKAAGVNYMMRKLGATAKPTLYIARKGNQWSLKTETTFKTTEFTFAFDEEFQETTTDGRKVKSTISKEGEKKWIHYQKDPIPSTITREITDDNTLHITCTAKDVTSKRVYKRIA